MDWKLALTAHGAMAQELQTNHECDHSCKFTKIEDRTAAMCAKLRLTSTEVDVSDHFGPNTVPASTRTTRIASLHVGRPSPWTKRKD